MTSDETMSRYGSQLVLEGTSVGSPLLARTDEEITRAVAEAIVELAEGATRH